jgi:hypothetical protein
MWPPISGPALFRFTSTMSPHAGRMRFSVPRSPISEQISPCLRLVAPRKVVDDEEQSLRHGAERKRAS